MNSNNRIATTLYSLWTVCLRNIGIKTLHNRGDDDDEDDNNNNNYFLTPPCFQRFDDEVSR